VKKIPKETKVLSANTFPVVGIGASAGGLDAFKKLLKAIPENSGMAYVLVQHLDPNHESLLPDLLQKVTDIPVLEIADDMRVEPNHIYVIPSNKMMVANDGVLQLTTRPLKNKNERNLPIDLFFTSLAEVHQSHAIGVVLSGTATDGTFGLKAIKDHGGLTFAQDEKSAAYDSMPNSAVQAGVVDFILPPEKIPSKIIELNKSMNGQGHDEQVINNSDEDTYRQIISLLRIRKGTDFTYYKKSTVRRRILRRMALSKSEELSGYLKYLRENKPEQDVLYQDMLIPVTSFFRDPKSFDNLAKVAIPFIAKSKTAGEPIRVWVAGCSTGEEAYSIAICLEEFFGDHKEKFQIFATDINELCIAKARTGIYTKKEVEKLTPQQLQEFFTKKEGNYQINKSIRDTFVFAVHNFLKDPPFGKMDLISCRNVFIYMEPYLQKKALTTFHYALNKKGFLLLGKSETISGVTDLFASADKTDKLFTRKDVPTKLIHSASRRSEQDLSDLNINLRNETPRTDFQKTADDIILSKYTPVGVVVNEALDVVHFRGSTGNYLEQAPGKPSYQVLKMAKHGLAFELRNLLHKAKKENKSVAKNNIPFKIDGHSSTVTIEVIPLPNIVEPHYLILFHDASQVLLQPKLKGKKALKVKADNKDKRIEQLGHELAQTHEDMRSITEDQEAANEELQSANEELLSSSEEAQSLNEELETSKEELQSTNEELIVVNQELLNLNEHLTGAKEYAEVIIATIREPLLVLDKNLRVKTANQSYYKAFNVKETEVEGKLIYELDNQRWDIPALRKLLETILPEKSVFNDLEITQTFSGIGRRIMLLNARELTKAQGSEKLILLAIKDITERKNHELQIQELLHRFQNLVAQAPVSICIIRKEGYYVELANDAYLQLLNRGKDFINKPLFESIPELIPQGFKDLLDKVMQTGIPFYANEMEVPFTRENKTESGFFSFCYQPLREQDGSIAGVIAVGYEVTEQVIAKRKNLEDQAIRSKELEEKVKERTAELKTLNEILLRENEEKEKRAAELVAANAQLAFQNTEKEKRGTELIIANQELESFTYVASHDLQEPLRKIHTFAKMVAEKETERLSENGKDYFQRIGKAANRMQILIDDLLSYSRNNTKAHTFENADLTKIAQEVMADFKETIDEKQATFETGNLGTANVIPFQFRQLIQNLIGNALKFSSSKRPPHISIKSEILEGLNIPNKMQEFAEGKIQPEKMYHHISVADNGIGFEPKFEKRIFDLFQRLHGKEVYAGTGIGLAIVKKIVENHNGIITAKGELDKGATFDIYLPEAVQVVGDTR
jgi:two-component system, chemotaxis family, CheB/CheR fusion protein